MSVVEARESAERRRALSVVPEQTDFEDRRSLSGRRWDDRSGEFATTTFAHFLTGRPEPDEAVRLLVALLCWPIGAQGALITRRTDAGTRMIASYVDQVPALVGGSRSQTLAPDVEEIVAAASGAQPALWTQPDGADKEPMAAWLLGPVSDPAGVLVIFLSTPMEDRLVAMRANSLAEILGLYLVGNSAHTSGNGGWPSTVELKPESLTVRQQQILAMMANGLTNPQIASRIGFSTSTVRMESLAIYRALGVHDRQNAVTAGRSLGLLESP